MNPIQYLKEDFVNETLKLKFLLLSTEQGFDNFDNYSHNLQEQIEFIEKNKVEIFRNIDNHFFNIWRIYSSLDKKEEVVHRKYFQEQLVPLFNVSPYNKRIYEKPLGYAGDYIVMNYLYENGYEGETTFAKFIHRYSMRIPTAKANHNRKNFYKEHISYALKNIRYPKIASIASGPAVEIQEVLKENPLAKDATFSLLDLEKEALDYVKDKVDSIEQESGNKFNVNYIHSDIRTLLKNEKIDKILENQNLIFSSGLIDYFTDRLAMKAIEVLFNKINRGGRLIIGNVAENDEFRAYTEILGEWHINYRSLKDMLKLTANLSNKCIEIDYEKETQMNIFLIIKKI